MTYTTKDHLIDWLRDAHAMEEQSETMLESQASRLDHYPALQQRIRAHAVETKEQQGLLEACLEQLGSEPSTLKDTVGKMTASAQAMSGMMATDEVVKGAMAGYVFEHMEIASYISLIAAAERAGFPNIAQTLRTILTQEDAMARWFEEHMAYVTVEFLDRDERSNRYG